MFVIKQHIRVSTNGSSSRGVVALAFRHRPASIHPFSIPCSEARILRVQPGRRQRLIKSHVHPVQQPLLVLAAANGEVDTILSATAWVVVLGATAAAFRFMFKAFFEAKSVIERRSERERAKEDEDQQRELERQQKIKKMFERL